MEQNKLRFCSKCTMDGSCAELVLYDQDICNFCHSATKALKEIELEKPNLDKWIKKIKEHGKGKKYDILVGASGGVDSSTVLHYAVTLGLRPLVFSIDNGFQDPRADSNVLQIVEKLKIPFYRYVLDLKKFADLQGAYLKAGVVNVEACFDKFLAGASYEMASQYGIKYILSGGNVASESCMPVSWSFPSGDLVNMKDIYKKMTGKRLKGVKGSFPLFGTLSFNYYKHIKKIKVFYLLDYLNYNRKESEQMLIKTYNYQSCGGKHEENIFTRWFQAYYLYQKFNIDKRKCFYSSLIQVNQMTRQEAMFLLTASPVYPSLGIESKVMGYPKRRHEDFKQDLWFGRISKLVRFFRRWT